MCLVSLCVLRPTNFGFVQCLYLGSLWNFAHVCFNVLLASPRKHRVCERFFASAFVRLCLSRFVMRTLPHKHRVCAVLFSRFPFKSVYAYVCHVLLCVLCLTNIVFVSAFPSGSPFLNVCTIMFVTFCYAYFPSQTSGLCSAFQGTGFFG